VIILALFSDLLLLPSLINHFKNYISRKTDR
jgi:hypothetical protein